MRKIFLPLILTLSISSAAATPSTPLPQWNLSELYLSPEDPQIEQDFQAIEKDIQQFNKTYGSLTQENLKEAIATLETLQTRLARLQFYGELIRYTHLNDPKFLKFHTDLSARITQISLPLVDFPLEIARRADLKPIGKYAYWMTLLQKNQAYLLDPTVEKILAEHTLPATSAWVELYNKELDKIRVTVGEEELLLSQVFEKMRSPDRKIREETARTLAKTIGTKEDLFVHIFNTLLLEKSQQVSWRGLATPELSAHIANDIDPKIIEALEISTLKHASLLQRFYRLKARALGLEKLKFFDRSAPVGNNKTRFSWQQAQNLVISVYQNFDPEFGKIAKDFVLNGWIDAEPRAGKYPGAFNAGVPDHHAYILLNFQGRANDVSVFAHEMGHAIHHQLSKSQGALLGQPPLILAETASLFGEMLVFQRLLKELPPEEQLNLLAQQIQDRLSQSFFQISFYRFEKLAHRARTQGTLTPAQLKSLWLQVNEEIEGGTVDNEPDTDRTPTWPIITHFFQSPFYVYAYAFGDAIVSALFQIYQENPKDFVQKYKALLASGGSKNYLDLLKPLGLDPTDPSFWDKAFIPLEHLIDDFEKALEESESNQKVHP